MFETPIDHRTNQKQVEVRGKNYKVDIFGKGKIPCLLVGMGTLMMRTLPQAFLRDYTVYSSDLYWFDSSALPQNSIDSMTMADMKADLHAIADQLGLENYVVIAHSAFGLLGLEFAASYPQNVKGLVMIGTPAGSNQQVAVRNNRYFEENASPERKRIDRDNRAQFTPSYIESLPADSVFAETYVHRDAARYWADPKMNCSDLWQGLEMNQLLINHFFGTPSGGILPSYNPENDLNKVLCPIYLASGIYDYDCCPFLGWKDYDLPPAFKMVEFKKSGHWPQYEEPEEFMESVKGWISTLKLGSVKP